MNTEEYFAAIDQKLDAVIHTQTFITAELKQLEEQINRIKAEMHSQYVAYDARTQQAYELAIKAKA